MGIIYSTNSDSFASLAQAELTKKGYKDAVCYGFASDVGVDLVYNDKRGRKKMGRFVYTYKKKGQFEYTNIKEFKFVKTTVDDGGDKIPKVDGAHVGFDDDALYYDNYAYDRDQEA